MQSSEKIDQLAKAHAAVCAEVPPPVKNKTNPHLKNKYADLEAIMKVLSPALTKHGLSWATFPTIPTQQGHVALGYKLTHAETGQWWGDTAEGPIAKQDMQTVGGGYTYLRRYTTCAQFNIVADDDDDGNTATGRTAPAQKPSQGRSQPSQPIATEKQISDLKAKYAAVFPGKAIPEWKNLTVAAAKTLWDSFLVEEKKQKAGSN